MGSSFKLFGAGFAEQLIQTTSNPFVGLFIGILATSVIQSSSTTTSLVVGLVACGGLTIGNAIPIIMGANIGTSVTNTIVSLGHITRKLEFKKAFAGATVHDFFNVMAVIVFFPLEMMTGFFEKTAIKISGLLLGTSGVSFNSPLNVITKPVCKAIVHAFQENAYLTLILSAVLLFGSLYFIVKIMRSLVFSKMENVIDKYLFKNDLTAFVLGILLTVLVQSSSVTTSLAVPMVGAGLLTLKKIFPFVIGANIGTTITAVLASLATDSTAAITIAIVHVMFNILGVSLLYPLKKIPIYLAKTLASYSVKSKFYPILYIGILFFLIPLILIYFAG